MAMKFLTVMALFTLGSASVPAQDVLTIAHGPDPAPVCGKCGKDQVAEKASAEERFPKPVCGTDGNVYSSFCAMKRAACEQNSQINKQDWDSCVDKQSLCPDKCLDIYDPVCGQDNVIYLNYCVMQRKNCGKRMKTIDLVSCLSKVREARKLDACPENCAPIYEPVCDSEGDVHYNECFFRKAMCENGVTDPKDFKVKMLPLKACVDFAASRCPDKCLPIMDPVCGSDGKRYLNHCKFAQDNCEKGTKKMPWVYCLGEVDVDTLPTEESEQTGKDDKLELN